MFKKIALAAYQVAEMKLKTTTDTLQLIMVFLFNL
jgi:hypothetical protein